MKNVGVRIHLWEKGDRVHTYEGIGTVMEDEEIPNLPSDVYYRIVKVKLDEGTSSHPNGIIDIESPESIFLINE